MAQQSISQRLHDNLVKIIASTPPGERLPSEPALAVQLGVSRATLREAMRTFESQGMLRRKQGSGTYVTHPSATIDSGLEVLESIETMAQRTGLPVNMGTLQVDQRLATEEECKILGTQANCLVVEISRVIHAENRPVAYLIDILPSNILTPEELDEGFSGSVLDFLLTRGSPELSVARTDITATNASIQLARHLGIQRGDTLLRFTANLYAENGQVIDHSLSYFLPGYFHFHVVRRLN
jgi:GntR family transcriptional regulator